MYGTFQKIIPVNGSVSVVHGSEFGPVLETASAEGVLRSEYSQRSGSNDPRNGPLLFFMRKTKPQRVRFYVKKVIVGYRFIYKKVYFRVKITKAVRSKTPYYTFHKKTIQKVTRSKKLVFVRKRFKRLKWKRSVRYYETYKVRFRKVAIRVPIKVRIRLPIIIPPVVGGDSSAEPPGTFLRPNLLSFSSYSERQLPSSVHTVDSFDGNFGNTVVRHDLVAGVLPPITINGTTFVLSHSAFSADIQYQPLGYYEDLYDSSTAIHGLYKKIASSLPSTFTSLAELPETIKAVLTVFKDGVKLFKRLKHLDASGVYSSLNYLSKSRKDSLSGLSSKVWLQWYLAINPTVNDISDHLALLTREGRVWRKYQKTVTSESFFADDSHPYYYAHQKTTTKFKYSVIVEGRATIDEYKKRAADADVLTSALYAVVPLSFVADWAVDLSAYLESATVLEGLNYTPWQTSSTKVEEFEKSSFLNFHAGAGVGVLNHPYRRHVDRFRMDRLPLLSLPDMPLIPWKRALVDQTVINRSLTSLALLRVLLSKKS